MWWDCFNIHSLYIGGTVFTEGSGIRTLREHSILISSVQGNYFLLPNKIYLSFQS